MNSTTIQISHETKKRIDGYKKHPRATYDETLNWIFDELEESDTELEEANEKFERKKEDY